MSTYTSHQNTAKVNRPIISLATVNICGDWPIQQLQLNGERAEAVVSDGKVTIHDRRCRVIEALGTISDAQTNIETWSKSLETNLPETAKDALRSSLEEAEQALEQSRQALDNLYHDGTAGIEVIPNGYGSIIICLDDTDEEVPHPKVAEWKRFSLKDPAEHDSVQTHHIDRYNSNGTCSFLCTEGTDVMAFAVHREGKNSRVVVTTNIVLIKDHRVVEIHNVVIRANGTMGNEVHTFSTVGRGYGTLVGPPNTALSDALAEAQAKAGKPLVQSEKPVDNDEQTSEETAANTGS